ncbi:Integrin beta [Caligus rogercresseyi]|uniref:Integrin beta n=1 Tax=Caligus rogercresseyi TaxID=217165 RepID=A0A7T8HG15_CALRO|nr:Integrin beta [Caligus rogercresseyi]
MDVVVSVGSRMELLTFLLLLFPIGTLGSISSCKDESGNDITHCNACMVNPGCVWCNDRQPDGMARGCMTQNEATANCENPIDLQSSLELTVNKALDTDSPDKKIRISPQESLLTLRPNHPVSLDFEVALSDNPVDIYFLMDLSSSMNKSKSNLIDASESIAERISELSSSFKIGFGSFSDKLVPPFGMTKKYSDSRGYLPSYGYRHQMSLGTNVKEFRERVFQADLAGNVDSPESGLEALSQAILCEEEVGWTPGDVRRVIIFISDKEQHYALDGKMGGLYRLSDGKCSLDSVRGANYLTYSKSDVIDYPSFGQIRQELKQKNVIVIFAIESFMVSLYRDLSLFLQGTDNVGALTDDPSSIEEIVVEQYRSIKNRIILSVNNSVSESLFGTLEGNCSTRHGGQEMVCQDVKTQKPYHFRTRVELSPEACNENDDPLSYKIQLQGFEKDTLFQDHVSALGMGISFAGAVSAMMALVGNTATKRILVSLTQRQKRALDVGSASVPNVFAVARSTLGSHVNVDPRTRVCNGRGVCGCRESNSTVPRCECDAEYKGEHCDCPSSQEGCKAALTGNEICSGRGECICGKCQNCKDGYLGDYCQIDPVISVCSKLSPCVKYFLLQQNYTGEDLSLEDRLCSSNLIGEIFRPYMRLGCKVQDKFVASDSFSLLIGEYSSCDLMSRRYEESQIIKEEDEGDFPTRGDLGRVEQIRKIDVSQLKFCTFRIGDCNVEYFHNRLDSNDIYEEKDNLGDWSPYTNCRAGLSLPLILGSSAGSLVLFGIVTLVAAVVIVTTRDRRAYRQYEAWKAENIQNLQGNSNPTYIQPRSIVDS